MAARISDNPDAQSPQGDIGIRLASVLACTIVDFLDHDIRKRPKKLLVAFAEAGILVSLLYLMFLAVSVIDFSLNLTGLYQCGAVVGADAGGAGHRDFYCAYVWRVACLCNLESL